MRNQDQQSTYESILQSLGSTMEKPDRKVCTKCGEEKKLKEFNKQKMSKDGRSSHCTDCTVEGTRLGHAKKQKFIEEYKMSKGCELCGYCKHPAALCFDHIDPFTKNERLRDGRVAAMKLLSKKDLAHEISICRVLCHNCHFIHTYDQIKNNKVPNLTPRRK